MQNCFSNILLNRRLNGNSNPRELSKGAICIYHTKYWLILMCSCVHLLPHSILMSYHLLCWISEALEPFDVSYGDGAENSDFSSTKKGNGTGPAGYCVSESGFCMKRMKSLLSVLVSKTSKISKSIPGNSDAPFGISGHWYFQDITEGIRETITSLAATILFLFFFNFF